MGITFKCAFCRKLNKDVIRSSPTKIHFCNNSCKSEWQKLQRPVTVKWLRQKYILERLDCTQISKIVKRDPKSVWNWLVGSGIPTRKRGQNPRVHFKKGHLSGFAGRKHSLKTRRLFSKQKKDSGACPALINGVHWLHVYKDRHPAAWRGGITPERQAVYSSPEWKLVAKEVWIRDKRTCQRCGLVHKYGMPSFDIHHIVSFENKELRTEKTNLILLCEKCHLWTHSKKNKKKRFVSQ